MSQVTFSAYRAALFVVAILLAGCSDGTPSSNAGENASIPSVAYAQRQAKAKIDETLYVLNSGNREAVLSVFNASGKFLRSVDLGAYTFDQHTAFATNAAGDLYASPAAVNHKNTLNRYISRGRKPTLMADQRGAFSYLAVDFSNNVFTSCGTTRICEYATEYPPATKPIWSFNIAGYGTQVGAMAVDSLGDLAVSTANAVLVITPGSHKPSVIVEPDGKPFGAVAFDSSNNLYVSNYSAVNVYAPGSSLPMRTLSSGFSIAGDLAFDTAGDLFVANPCGTQCESGSSSITVFSAGMSEPSRIITDQIGSGALAIAVNGLGTLWVANSSGNVVVFAPGSSTHQKIITKEVNDPVAIAVGQ